MELQDVGALALAGLELLVLDDLDGGLANAVTRRQLSICNKNISLPDSVHKTIKFA